MKAFSFFCALLFPLLLIGQMDGDRSFVVPAPIALEASFAYDTLYVVPSIAEPPQLFQLPYLAGEIPAFEVQSPVERELHIAVEGQPETAMKVKLIAGCNQLKVALWRLGEGVWEVKVLEKR